MLRTIRFITRTLRSMDRTFRTMVRTIKFITRTFRSMARTFRVHLELFEYITIHSTVECISNTVCYYHFILGWIIRRCKIDENF